MFEYSRIALRTRKGDFNLGPCRLFNPGIYVLIRFVTAKRAEPQLFPRNAALSKITMFCPATDDQLHAVNLPSPPKALKQELREGVFASILCLNRSIVDRVEEDEQPRLR